MPAVSKSVLLIEDYDDDESLFLRALRQAHLTNPVLVLRTGEEALAYLQRIQSYTEATKHLVPSVLILDLKLPGKDGWDILAWLNTQPKLQNMLVVVVTGDSNPALLARVHQAGADSFLTKPVKAEDLTRLAQTFRSSWRAE